MYEIEKEPGLGEGVVLGGEYHNKNYNVFKNGGEKLTT